MTLKIGFVGTGGISQGHQNCLSKIEGVTVSAFTSNTQMSSDKAAQAHTHAKSYGSLTDMLDDQKLDAVYICVPPHVHEGLEEQLIERSIPFLVEKPLGINQELPLAIAKRLKETNLLNSVGYHWRYLDSAQRAKQLIADSDVKVGMALGYWMGTMPMADWWINYDTSGGQFVEQTTHIVDMLRLLCGEVSEVYAAFSQRVMHEQVPGTSVFDVGTVTMKLASGAVATISNSCLLPTYHKVGLDIYTNKGIIELQESCLKVTEADRVDEYKCSGDPLFRENEAFIHALRTGDRSLILSDYQDSLKTHKITLAANLSVKTGKPVQIEA
ncbi:MAG: Gfo/Idh/MocA family oxidoreductase [Gorillibacterium sp.]|nr:Gfo/Idh/MocA family oxidoreductase [Gorillibacterium sp.]